MSRQAKSQITEYDDARPAECSGPCGMVLPLKQGDVVGDYLVEEIIGVGGMAVVARASHRTYLNQVALKLLLPAASRSAQVQKRFERESRTLLQLQSEHTVRIYAAGMHGKLPYMVLELLEGDDLAELVKTRGPFDMDSAVQAILQACHALAEAHSRGIVHRDLKPGNLFLTRRHDGSPCVKVLDFGISKVSQSQLGGKEATLTRTQMVMGSPFYMSPEQMLSAKAADARSDVWALGVTLYELLSKSLPFAADSTEMVCQRILHDEPTPLRKILPLIPSGLEATIMRCLQRKPAARFANVADFAQRLADFGPEHARYSLDAIYAFVPPTEADPQLAQAAALVAPARDHVPTDNTTLYLKSAEPRGGLGGWMTLAVAAITFAVGGGLGWVMSLDTDPTRGGGAAPRAASTPALAASTQASSPMQAPPTTATPTAEHPAAQPGAQSEPIDLDALPLSTASPMAVSPVPVSPVPGGPPPSPPRSLPTLAPSTPLPPPPPTATATATPATATAAPGPAPPAPSNVTF